MMRLAISKAAAALLRALAERGCVERNCLLLVEGQSTDWQSLTFCGERHQLNLRITGAGADAAAARICDGLETAEFGIAGHVVADITVIGEPMTSEDGTTELVIEALTIASD